MILRRLAIITAMLVTSVSFSTAVSELPPTDVYGKPEKLSKADKLDFRRATLLQAYYQALKSDPTFKKATSDWESAKEDLPIARAAYLTQVALTGNAQRQFNKVFPEFSIPSSNGYNYDYGFILTVSQPVFNLPAWDAIRSARATVKAATATYSAASQDLMLRTVRAYLSVLQAYDRLRFQLARKRAVLEQLNVTRQQFKVGLIAITGVYDARSVYDQAVAQSIADQNLLNDATEELAVITGLHYLRLRGIGKQVPLVTPKPNDINAWTDVAERQNYGLIAQNYTVIAARETLKQQSTSWMPQLSIEGQYVNDNQSILHGESFFLPDIRTNNVLYGFTLNFPIIQGGLVTASTRQAKYNFLAASNERELTYRTVISDTRQSFLGVITGISKVKADWQSVISAQNALNATKAGYEVGTRTIVDVLDDVTSLYQEQQRYTDDQYIYIIDTIELKFNTGTLSVDDIKMVNKWLGQNIKLNLPEEALKSLQSRLRPIKPFPNVLPLRTKRIMRGRRPKHRTPPVTSRYIKRRKKHKKRSITNTVTKKTTGKKYARALDLPMPGAKSVAMRIPMPKQFYNGLKGRRLKHRTLPVTKRYLYKRYGDSAKTIAARRRMKRIMGNRWPKHRTVPVTSRYIKKRNGEKYARALALPTPGAKIARKEGLPRPSAAMRIPAPKQLHNRMKGRRPKHRTPLVTRRYINKRNGKKYARALALPMPTTKVAPKLEALHQSVSLEERVIPLYEKPPAGKQTLPGPAKLS